MTTKARVVLSDCRAEVEDFAKAAHLEWRRGYVTMLALLRAVGHVLDKTDGENGDDAMKCAIKDAYAPLKATKPEPALFWQFIEDERNSAVKAYEFTPAMAFQMPLPFPVVVNGQRGWSPGDFGKAWGPKYLFLPGSPFAGQYPHQVARQAIDWWQQYLDAIDADAERRRQQSAASRSGQTSGQ